MGKGTDIMPESWQILMWFSRLVVTQLVCHEEIINSFIGNIMRTRFLALLLLAATTATSLMAGDWAPIPPDVWAIRSGPKGAVILEERMKFRATTIEYVYRVRIFAEEGRVAAGIPNMPKTAYGIKGHTVYPDGRQVEFNDRKDFVERTQELGGWTTSATHIVAPGITSDCVMEVAWTEDANGEYRGLPYRYDYGLYAQWILANSVPTKLLVIEIVNTFPLAWALDHGGVVKPDSKEESNYRVITFRDLPPFEIPPYGLRPLLNLPTLVMFYQPRKLWRVAEKDSETYWKEAVDSLYKADYEDGITKGSFYQSMAGKLLSGLPTSPGERAGELLNRLNQTIANLSNATFAEVAVLPKNFWDGFKHKDLEEAAKTGKTNDRGIRLLYYHLLKQAGFTPKIGKMVDREKALFQWNQKNPWQFHHDLIGIDLPSGGTAWFDPTNRYAAPGVVHPDYTGVNMLQIDSSTWKATRGVIAGLDHLANGRKYTYTLELAEDGDNLDIQAEFSGYPEYAERHVYMALEPQAQGKTLRKSFETAMKAMVVSEAEVSNATDPKKNVTWRVKGFIEKDSGRSREVYPFPGMPWPLTVPSQMDQERKTPIVLPYRCTQVAVSRFRVPAGYTPRLPSEQRDENEFGTVIWLPSFDAKTREVNVALRVEVKAISKGPDRWANFRVFLGWIETACRRQIVLVKES